MKTSIEGILREIKFNKSINYYYVILEALKNSFQAGATLIDIKIELVVEKDKYYINSIEITDNGDGFNKVNLYSFHLAYTLEKKQFGCKGVGRFAMLTVFDNINIKTFSNDEEIIEINFNKSYKGEFDTYKDKLIDRIKNPKTIFKFTNTESKKNNVSFKLNDKDEKNITNKIKQDLFPMLYFKAESGSNFTIKVKLLYPQLIDKEKNLPNEHNIDNKFFENFNIKKEKFSLKESIFKENFEIYYYIDKKDDFVKKFNNSKIILCANHQAVKEIKFSKKLPLDFKYFIFISGKFLDDIVNDYRIAFNFKKEEEREQADISFNITESKFKEAIVNKIIDILKKEKDYDIQKTIDELTMKTIKNYPFFKRYINLKDITNKILFEGEDKTFEALSKEFFQDKEKSKNIIYELKKKLESLSPINNESKISEYFGDKLRQMVASNTEVLGAFIYYRQAIIETGKLIINSPNLQESYIHNLFMQKNTASSNEDVLDLTNNNLWLFGDEFMTYSKVFSDKSIVEICKKEIHRDHLKGQKNKPDLFLIFLNKSPNLQNNTSIKILIVEFKRLTIKGFKLTQVAQQTNHYLIKLKQHYKNIRMSYNFIIGNIDEECEELLKLDGYKEFFHLHGKMFIRSYEYNHFNCYLNFESLILDSEERNKIFLNILEKATFN